MYALKGFLVLLDRQHTVNDFKEIDGVVYDLETEEEVIDKLNDFVIKMKKDIGKFEYHIINLDTGKDTLYIF